MVKGIDPPGRRERHKTATRLRLYEAAISLFAEKGYDKTSIDDIAERADVARATVFNYFERKDKFLDAWGDERRKSLTVAIMGQNSPEVSTQEQIRQCMRALAHANEQDRHIARTLVTAWVRAGGPVAEEPYTAHIFAQLVTVGIARGDLRADADPELVGHLLRDIYLGTLYRWLGDDSSVPPFDLRDHLLAALDVLLTGLAAAIYT